MARATKGAVKVNGKAAHHETGLGRMVETLPENVRSLPAVKRATEMVEEGEEAATAWMKARAHEAEKAYSRGVHEVEARKDEVVATVQDWMDKDVAKVKALRVVDGALDLVGLMRVAKHEAMLSEAVKSLKAKLRASRDRKARRDKEKQTRTRSGRSVETQVGMA